MENMVRLQKDNLRIALLHRFPIDQIKETNAAFPFLAHQVDTLTFKAFNRSNKWKKLLKSLWWVLYAWTKVIGKGYDVIYCDDSFPFYPILVRLACPKAKLVLRLGDFHLMYYCSGFLYRILHAIEKIGWRMADLILPISQTMQDLLHEEDFDKTVLVLDPVDIDRFPVREKREITRPLAVVFHGTIEPSKGLDVIVEAARLMPEARFTICGAGSDLQRLNENAPPNIEFTGWIPHNEIMDFVSSVADVGIAIRSNNRGNQYVVTSAWLQYLAMGIPCVASDRLLLREMNYPYLFKTSRDLVLLLNEISNGSRYCMDDWVRYVRTHHDAKRIAWQIMSLLLSWEDSSPLNYSTISMPRAIRTSS